MFDNLRDKFAGALEWIGDHYKSILLIMVGLITFLVVGKILFLVSIQSYFFNLATSQFGLDAVLAQLASIFLTVITVLAMPWIIAFLLYGGRKKELAAVTLVVSTIFYLGLYFGTGNVLFDRDSGKPVKYYIKTLDGFKFSSSQDKDPIFGIAYKEITPEVAKEYALWEKVRKHEKVPEVVPGQYFDMLTGEPKTWYVERASGEIDLFSLPGYDPKTGKVLKPMTSDMVEKMEKKASSQMPTGISSEQMLKYVKDNAIHDFDVDWYLRVSENAYRLKSEKTRCTQMKWESSLLGGSRPAVDFNYNASIEKVIFLGSYTIIGINIMDTSGGVDFSHAYLVDINGVRHEPIRTMGSDPEFTDCYVVRDGEFKRILLVFDKVVLAKLGMATMYIANTPINFSIAKKESAVLW